jgi:hypothetical protein
MLVEHVIRGIDAHMPKQVSPYWLEAWHWTEPRGRSAVVILVGSRFTMVLREPRVRQLMTWHQDLAESLYCRQFH